VLIGYLLRNLPQRLVSAAYLGVVGEAALTTHALHAPDALQRGKTNIQHRNPQQNVAAAYPPQAMRVNLS